MTKRTITTIARVSLTPAQARFIESHVRALSETDEMWGPTMATYNALFIYGDIGGSIYLRPTGELLWMDHTTDAVQPLPVGDRWAQIAIIRAARVFPELASLRPPRQPHHRDCSACGATGGSDWSVCWTCL